MSLPRSILRRFGILPPFWGERLENAESPGTPVSPFGGEFNGSCFNAERGHVWTG